MTRTMRTTAASTLPIITLVLESRASGDLSPVWDPGEETTGAAVVCGAPGTSYNFCFKYI